MTAAGTVRPRVVIAAPATRELARAGSCVEELALVAGVTQCTASGWLTGRLPPPARLEAVLAPLVGDAAAARVVAAVALGPAWRAGRRPRKPRYQPLPRCRS